MQANEKEVAVDLKTLMGNTLPNLSMDDLKNLSRAIRQEIDLRIAHIGKTMRIGDTYSFVHAGIRKEGVIKKINEKTVSILVGTNEKWSVSPNLLTKV